MLNDNKVFTDSKKQQEFDANFEENTKVYVSTQKQEKFDKNFQGNNLK